MDSLLSFKASVGVAEEDGLEFVVHGFRCGERSGEGEEIVVGLNVSFFEGFSKKFWTVVVCGSEILFDGFKIWVTS